MNVLLLMLMLVVAEVAAEPECRLCGNPFPFGRGNYIYTPKNGSTCETMRCAPGYYPRIENWKISQFNHVLTCAYYKEHNQNQWRNNDTYISSFESRIHCVPGKRCSSHATPKSVCEPGNTNFCRSLKFDDFESTICGDGGQMVFQNEGKERRLAYWVDCDKNSGSWWTRNQEINHESIEWKWDHANLYTEGYKKIEWSTQLAATSNVVCIYPQCDKSLLFLAVDQCSQNEECVQPISPYPMTYGCPTGYALAIVDSSGQQISSPTDRIIFCIQGKAIFGNTTMPDNAKAKCFRNIPCQERNPIRSECPKEVLPENCKLVEFDETRGTWCYGGFHLTMEGQDPFFLYNDLWCDTETGMWQGKSRGHKWSFDNDTNLYCRRVPTRKGRFSSMRIFM